MCLPNLYVTMSRCALEGSFPDGVMQSWRNRNGVETFGAIRPAAWYFVNGWKLANAIATAIMLPGRSSGKQCLASGQGRRGLALDAA